MRSTQLFVALACLASYVNAATVSITVGPALSYTPQQANANVGDTIVWTFKADHSVMESDALGSCTASTKAGAFASKEMATGTFTYTPTAPGTLFYFCGVENHCQLGMTGSIVVAGAGGSSNSSSSNSSASSSASASASTSASSSSSSPSAAAAGPYGTSAGDNVAPGVALGIMAVAGVGALLAL